MRKHVSHLFFALALGVGPSSVAAQDASLDRLSPEHRKWLEEEVPYIILDREREVFLSLQTGAERDRFIEAFWRKRDPNPVTPENEFKTEHYRRLAYANEFLGRETSRPGWMTDRGRMYIILGEPRSLERYDGYREIVSTELWFYQGEPRGGLPAAFYLLFFKRHDIGEYKLYNPTVDGPQALLEGQYTTTRNMQQIMNMLTQVSPELARASLSLDPSDPADFSTFQPSLGTPFLIARIEESPKLAVQTDYADAWLRYGNRVSADYSFNFVPSRSVLAVLAGPEDTPFVHYSVEIDPQNFSLEATEDQSKFYTTLDVSFEVRGPDGNLVANNDRESYIELTPNDVQKVRSSPFAYQDDFPLVPGQYTVSVILRNRVLHQYTVAERELTVPIFGPDRPWLSDVVLGFATEPSPEVPHGSDPRTFEIDGLRLHPAADGLFALGQTLYVMVQAGGASDSGARVRWRLLDGGEVLQERFDPAGNEEARAIVEEFPLFDVAGGSYVVEAQMVDSSGQVLATASSPVQVSPRSFVPRASFVFRRSFNTRVPGLLALARGDQLRAKGELDAAQAELERAVAADNPQLAMARWKLAELLLRQGNADRVIALLAPLEPSFPETFEVVGGLGFAHYLRGDFATAIPYLDRAAKLASADTRLLNALGDSLQKTGDLVRAKETFEKSLELDPKQTAIQERLASLSAR